MSDTQQQETDERYARQGELNAKQRADQIGIKSQHEQVSKHKFNPGFYDETADPDLDSELYNWIENLLGPKVSKAQVLGNRPEEFVESQSLLNRNEADRIIAEMNPGALVKKNPAYHALLMGIRDLSEVDDPTDPATWIHSHPDATAPIETTAKRRVIRDALEVETTRESMAVEGMWADALTKATTETAHRDQREDDVSESKRRLSGVFR